MILAGKFVGHMAMRGPAATEEISLNLRRKTRVVQLT